MEKEELKQMLGFSDFGKKRNISLDRGNKLKQTARSLDQTEQTANSQSYNLKSDDNVKQVFVKDDLNQQIRTSMHNDTTDSMEEDSSELSSDAEFEGSGFDLVQNPEVMIPEKNEVSIRNGMKQVSAVSVELSGTRLIAGGYDYDLNMWDFATMDHQMQPFRTFQPMECHQIRNLSFNLNNSNILVTAANAQVKVLDRDGRGIVECMKGDQYILDMGQTKGHVSTVFHSMWNPVNDNQFLSCGQDGTLRIWDIETAERANVKVIKVKDKRNKAVHVTHCSYTNSAIQIYASGSNGSIQAWDPRKSWISPTLMVNDANAANEVVSGFAIDKEDRYLTTRATDGTLKLWDLRSMDKCLYSAENLLNYYDTTKCYFTPDNKMIMTGTSIDKQNTTGHLLFYRVCDMKLCLDIPIKNAGVVCPFWSGKLNQIFVGCSDGNIRVYFDPEKSTNGVLQCLTRVKIRMFDPGESLLEEEVLTPLNRGDELNITSVKKIRSKARRDPILAKIPTPPCYGPGQGGRISSGMSLSSFVMKQMVMSNMNEDDANPREAILKYAKMAEEEPYFVAPAYKKTQPKAIFQRENLETTKEEDSIVAAKRHFSLLSSKEDKEESNKKVKHS